LISTLFKSPQFVAWGLAALAAGAGLAYWSDSRRGRLLTRFADPRIFDKLFDPEAAGARRTKTGLLLAALVLFFVALAGPQWGVELVATRARMTQVILAIDTSASMLAEDLKPDRMSKAKNALSVLIDELSGARIGLVAFAGEAFVQCPITTDREALKSLLRGVEVGMIPQPGTAVGKAIGIGRRLLDKYPGHKAIVLLTDGEDHGSHPLMEARAAEKAGVHLFIVGIGTPDGEPIPERDEEGRVIGYKKDSKGKTVVTRLGESGLIELAAATRGAYFRASSSDKEVESIIEGIEAIEKSDSRTSSGNRFKNRYRFPLCAGFFLLLFEMLITEIRRKPPPGSRAVKSPAAMTLAAALLFLPPAGARAEAPAQPDAQGRGLVPSDIRLWEGNRSYRAQDYGEALKQYQKADPKDPKTRFNAGTALYQLGDIEGAEELFEGVTDPDHTPKGMAPKAYYNLGNSLYRQKRLPESAEAYKRCLLLDPSDDDCRHNLVLALRPQKQKPQQDPKDKKDKDKDKKQQPKERPKNGGLSKEDAERILQAVKEKERQAQKEIAKRRKAVPRGGSPKEDW